MKLPLGVTLISILSLFTPGAVKAVPDDLVELGKTLAKLRALPVDTASSEVCPGAPKRFNALSREEIRGALGEPDYCEPGSCVGAREWSYFITAPIRAGQKGGGFPILSFVFEHSEKAESVQCEYAR